MSWTVADTEISIPEAFARQVGQRPSQSAAAGADWSPSFVELDRAANGIAHAVLERTGEGEGRVALLLRHDSPVLAAALGVLKAGKTAVVLNPTDPEVRLGQIRADVEPQLVVVDPRHRDLAREAGFPEGECLSLPDPAAGASAADPGIDLDPGSVAFIIHTSGTTGRPKGVMHSHRSILHNVLRQTNGLGIGAEDRVALPASLSGAQGLASSWVGLLNGATLCPFPIAERGAAGLTEWLAEREVTVLVSSASVFRACAQVLGDARLPTIRLLRLGSEPVRWEEVEIGRRHCAPDCVVASMYSSSEAGNITQQLIGPEAEPPTGPLSVGRAAEGVDVVIRDERGEPAPLGEVGEVTVRSAFLSPGYWRREELNAERFAADAGGNGTRVLRTGDLGFLGEDGSLTIAGRRDRVVKVHGNRVDPAEVEAALSAHPDIGAAAVVPSDRTRGEAALIAFVVAPGRSPTTTDLRSHVRERLPEHAVPGRIAFVDELPLTTGGAVDAERLAAPPVARESPARPAVGATEELVANAWADVLEVDAVDREAEFHELGGDSLSAAIVAARIHAATGAELELAAFVRAPTVKAMAAIVDRLRSAPANGRMPPLVGESRDSPLPTSFRQEFAFRHARKLGDSRFYTMAVPMRITGALDAALLRRAIEHLIRRHEALRTTFAERDGAVVQIVHPPSSLELAPVDLSACADPGAEATAALAAEADVGFDLERGPLARFRLLRLGPQEHRLLRITHHAISDAESWNVFFRELGELYQAFARNLPPPLADRLELQYGDFAARERRWLAADSPRFAAEVGWWRRRLADAPEPPRLPFVRPAPISAAAPRDGIIEYELPPDAAGSLEQLARAERTTRFTVRKALFALQLAAETGREEVVLATFVRNRRELAVQRMFGWFANGLALRLRFDPQATFRECLRAVRDDVAEANAHTAIPLERLTAELRRRGVAVPRTQAIVSERTAPSPLRFAGLELEALPQLEDAMPLGFSHVIDPGPAIRASIRFDANHFDPDLVRGFVDRSQRFAAAVAADPDLRWRPTARELLPRRRRMRRPPWLRRGG